MNESIAVPYIGNDTSVVDRSYSDLTIVNSYTDICQRTRTDTVRAESRIILGLDDMGQIDNMTKEKCLNKLKEYVANDIVRKLIDGGLIDFENPQIVTDPSNGSVTVSISGSIDIVNN